MKGQRFTLAWFVEGQLSEYDGKTDIGAGYVLGADYKPLSVMVRAKKAPGTDGVVIDINDDGASLFDVNPGLSNGLSKSTFHTFNVSRLAKGSIITLDLDVVGSTESGANLTVQLELEEV